MVYSNDTGLYTAHAGCYGGSYKCCAAGQLDCQYQKDIDPQFFAYSYTNYYCAYCGNNVNCRYGCSSECRGNEPYGTCCVFCWAIPFFLPGTELLYDYPTSSIIIAKLIPLAPGTYQIGYKRVWVKRDVRTDFKYCYYDTSLSVNDLTVEDKYTIDGGPSACIDCDINFGNAVVDAGAVLGSEKGEIRIKGTLNLVSRASVKNPIRIIFKKIIFDGGEILIPDQNDGRAYFVKVGSQDPYVNAPAYICSTAYDTKMTIKYCGNRSLCSQGKCDLNAFDISYGD